ncbi:MAG: ABC transporter substrate-binding protein [Sciscionella sp.]
MIYGRSARTRRYALVGVPVVAALVLSACATSERGGADANTLTFGAAGAPEVFDPFYATDGETFRVTRQIFDNLVTFKPGTAQVQPQLATEWKPSADGRTWTFTLRKGVTFTDGTRFDAKAACANFERWYDQHGAGQSNAVSQYWGDNFGGFSDHKEPSLYAGCTVTGDYSIDVKLTRASSKMPDILGLASWGIQSPTALKRYDANDVKVQGDGFSYPPNATEHPTGSGPFRFRSYNTTNNTITLVRNDNYWGPKPKLNKIIFKIYKDTTATKQALENGEIDGYDLPQPQDVRSLRDAGNKILERPIFNLMYLGIDQKNNPKLRDLRVRKAIAYAIDRKQIVTSQYPEGATVADQFLPSTVDGYADNVTQYPYDPRKAKDLLKQAGAQNLTLNFYWPSEVTRPYMPTPKDHFDVIRANLEKVGITINEKSEPWNGGYLDDLEAHKPDLFFLGWTGDFDNPDNFLSDFFGTPTNRFDIVSSPWGRQLSAEVKRLDGIENKDQRITGYQRLSAKIMSDYLPGVPIASSPSPIVVAKNVDGLVPSPLSAEEFGPVRKG